MSSENFCDNINTAIITTTTFKEPSDKDIVINNNGEVKYMNVEPNPLERVNDKDIPLCECVVKTPIYKSTNNKKRILNKNTKKIKNKKYKR